MADFKARWVGGSIVADSFSKKRWRELLAQRKRGRQAAEQEDEDIPLLLLLGAHDGSPFSSLAATSGAPSFLISSGISIKCFCKWLSDSNGAVTQTQLRKPCGWPVVARRLRCVRRRPIYWPHYVVACCAGRMPLVLDDHCPRPAKQGRSRLRCEP